NRLAKVGPGGLGSELRPEAIHHHFSVQFVARLESEELDEVGGSPAAPGIRRNRVSVNANLEASQQRHGAPTHEEIVAPARKPGNGLGTLPAVALSQIAAEGGWRPRKRRSH